MRDPHDHRVDRARVGEAPTDTRRYQSAPFWDRANDLGPVSLPPGIGARSYGDVPAPRETYLPWLYDFDRAAECVEEAQSWESCALAQPDPAIAETARVEANERWLSAAMRIALFLALLAPTVAAAQSDEDRLMRTAWSECGVDCAPHEIAALHEVIAGIAEREDVRWSTAWRLASPRLAAGTISRTWLAGITERCEEPAGWPRVDFVEADGSIRRAPRWSRWRARCLTLAENVRAVMSGEVTSLCAAAPRVWGDVRDRARGEARGRARFVEVDCGETALVFGEWEAL